MSDVAQILSAIEQGDLGAAERPWTYARTWLLDELKDRDDSANS